MIAGQFDISAQGDAAETQARCTVCDHHLDHHDHIGKRYCQATQAQALTRNCICPERTT